VAYEVRRARAGALRGCDYGFNDSMERRKDDDLY
jgi:hypothetical protein